MFTGIIEELGAVIALRRESNVARLAIQATTVREDLRSGDSLATNGVCLTVERIETAQLWLTMMPETLRRTTLGTLKPGNPVNLERAVCLNGRLGGHLLSGHVDDISTLMHIAGSGEERVYTFSLPQQLAHFIAPQGAIAIDGISLTVVDVTRDSFTVSLIRYTLSMTTLAYCTIGAQVNIEVDLIARYLNRLISNRHGNEGLTFERLQELGF